MMESKIGQLFFTRNGPFFFPDIGEMSEKNIFRRQKWVQNFFGPSSFAINWPIFPP